MFGYVRPRRDLLDPADTEAYQAAYCGLCRALGKQYGFAARFLVSYDMTFLYLLRASAQAPAKSARCWCPARVCGKKSCKLDPVGYEITAACTVILTVEKLRDNVRDKGFIKGLPYRLLSRFFRRTYRKAAKRLPDFAALTARQLDRLHSLEAENSPSIDATADAFAQIVAGCCGDVQDPLTRRPMKQLLYQTGRFLYLADALDDLEEDCKQKTYNPLRFRFTPENGKLSDEDQRYMTQLTDGSVNLAGAALALLPLRAYGPLLENIVYLGLPAVFQAVKMGKFQAGASPWQRTEKKKQRPTGDTI